MDKKFYTIGKICKKAGITISTLRFYESLGIIKPAYINENTGYRYYSLEHFGEIEIIKMCKKLDFPLKKIKEMQENQDINELLKFIRIQKIRARKKLIRYQAIVSDINWLEDTWKDIAEKEKYIDPNPCIKTLPKRTVIMTYLKNSNDKELCDNAMLQMPILQMQIQELSAKELNCVDSIKSNYGYKLDLDGFKNGKLKLISEYVELPKYPMTPQAKLVTIPDGKYVCVVTRMFSDKKWIKTLLKYLETNKLNAKQIYASEISLYFFDWRNTFHQIEILI